jgi:multiple sugar transport system ATP-binding protein
MSALTLQGLSKAYKHKPALDRLDLIVQPESFTVLCGPPKSGKSVLFRLLVGLEKPDAGTITLDGRDITRDPPGVRPIGYVPQSFALYPHLSVYDNIAYPLTLSRAPRDEIARRVDRAAGILSITHLFKKTPDQLSGGEKQRTALARGLLKNAQLFVLDDPLVGLDYKLRERLMDELKALRESLKATFLYATSDSLEALTMAQNLVVMDAGRVVQHDEAIRLYHEPRHLRSLELVGFPQANILEGIIANGTVSAGPLRFKAPGPYQAGAVKVGFRPEAIRQGQGRGLDGSGRVTLVENLGGELVVYIEAEGTPLVMGFPSTNGPEPRFDGDLRFTIDPAEIMLFDAGSGARLTPSAEV